MDQLATSQRRMHEEASENRINGVTRLRHLPLLSTLDHLDCMLERALRSMCEAVLKAADSFVEMLTVFRKYVLDILVLC